MAFDKIVDSAALDAGMSIVADAIRAKGGTTGALSFPTGFADAIAAIQTGGGGGSTSDATMKDVNFYDYDGTLVASYTLSEAQALTALPDGPTHDGLTFRGWNWTLEAIKALNQPVTVGAMYITNDGATRIHIRIATAGRMKVPLYIGQTVANGVSIDWGDGSAAETLNGTGNVNTSHTYSEPGDYVISLMSEDGCTLSFGANSSSYCVMGPVRNNSKVYCNMLQDVHVGTGVTSIGTYAFNNCYSLASVTIPESVTSIGNSAFNNCFSLASFTIPDGVTSIGNSSFYNCYSLASVTIPESVTSIGNSSFAYCYSLDSVTIPESVTSIGNSAFNNCFSLASVTIPESVTSIGNSAFNSCFSLASFTIPDGVTSIGTYAFSSCDSLASVTIPDGVTSIGTYAFSSCYGVAEYHLKPTTPPTLSSTNAFNNIPSDCIIYVPKGCLEAYQNATNWATYASYMQEEAA